MYPGAEIAAALRCAPGQAVVEVPGTVLFATRERAVFVPLAAPTRQAQALAFFTNSAHRRITGALQLRIGRCNALGLMPAKLALPAGWCDRFDANLEAAALYCGSSSPLQKASILLPARGEKGGIAHVVKIALRPTADEPIAREAQCLAGLADTGADVRRHVPALIADGVLPSGRRYVVTTASNGRRGSATLQDNHLQFLKSLAQATRTDMRWEDGDALSHTRERLRALGARALGADAFGLLEGALQASAAQLRGERIPHTLMHGDFTRFNIRQNDTGFVVFDWEYSRARSNPIADALHYRLSRQTIFGAKRALQRAIADASRFVDLALDGWRPPGPDLAALALHALVDTVVFYATADGRLDTRSFVVRRYLELIEARRSWLPHDAEGSTRQG